MSLISLSESPVVSPGASTVQKYTPLSHHITSLITKSASVHRQTRKRTQLAFCFLHRSGLGYKLDAEASTYIGWGPTAFKLTVLKRDLALAVFCSQNRLIASSLLEHCAHCALTVWTVIGRVLSQLQSRLVCCTVEATLELMFKYFWGGCQKKKKSFFQKTTDWKTWQCEKHENETSSVPRSSRSCDA